MTLAQAKKVYIAAGGPDDHSESEWKEIHKEMGAVVSAKTDRAAADLIRWWDCWDTRATATKWARAARAAWRKIQEKSR